MSEITSFLFMISNTSLFQICYFWHDGEAVLLLCSALVKEGTTDKVKFKLELGLKRSPRTARWRFLTQMDNCYTRNNLGWRCDSIWSWWVWDSWVTLLDSWRPHRSWNRESQPRAEHKATWPQSTSGRMNGLPFLRS